ncbi:uncharacterized protein K460DRAFT_362013 [Cucurbitaria berberidis CBS 394.84]|uniref:Uncharacterized protein n=1 Tax=Cucurbitaria berberidis CBS 394.84 TaxID=1168544 RepID=A0A9P4GUF5_9PLEO|nr:uncharacterized protein K460DRAFT_362013 [Cucurbitaria berberidis CBS 394.84]KAF1851246.1 hypothetical protein K460DRAFT_362013 [Cucurbitaria berberidis CBS 394.84]
MLPNKRKATEAILATPNKKPRIPSYKPSKSSIPTSMRDQPTTYPWDSYQDAIVVNSVEFSDMQQRVGAEHYSYMLSCQKHYKHICVGFDEYRYNGLKIEDLPELDDNDDDEEQDLVQQENLDPTINTTRPPDPPPSHYAYPHPIYQATTSNPAIPLAILRIAQKNLSSISFDSAIAHLPNLAHADPLPKLTSNISPEDIKYKNRDNAIRLNVAFLPEFYNDGRHALGYYTLSQASSSNSSPMNARRRMVGACLFTPCTIRDLEVYNLVKFMYGRKHHGVEGIKSVGVRQGRWVEKDVVEDWDEWSLMVKVVGRVWQVRLLLLMGGQEDGNTAVDDWV